MENDRDSNAEPVGEKKDSTENEGRWTKLDFWLCALHLFTLCSLALAKPIYDVTAKDAAFYVVRGSRPVDIISLILILSVLIPAALALVELLLGLVNRRLRLSVHFLFIFTLISLYGAQFVKQFKGLDGFLSASIILSIGVCGALLYARTQSFRRLVSLASPVIILFPLLFVFGSQVGQIIKPGGFVWSNDEGKTKHVYLKKKPPIVFVIMDELPLVSLLDAKSNIDAKRFPNLAGFAETSYWFRNATAVSAQTTSAIPAILTGIMPTKKLLPNLVDHPNNLFTFLGNNYNFNIFESATYLCPEEFATRQQESLSYLTRMNFLFSDLSVVYLHILLPAAYMHHLPSITNQWGNFTQGIPKPVKAATAQAKKPTFTDEDLQENITSHLSEDRSLYFRRFIDKIGSDSKESLNFVHIMLPHNPMEYLPSGKKHSLNTEINGVLRVEDRFVGPQGLVDQYNYRHVLQLAFMDRLLGELLDRLKKHKLFEESLIVVMADHGAGFTANDFNRKFSTTNTAELMFIPLIIKVPKQKNGVISDINAESIDVMPTIADVLGVNLPWEATGTSLLATTHKPRPKKTILSEDGSIHNFTDAQLLSARAKSLARNTKQFGLDDEQSTLFWFGKHRSLLGKAVTEFETRQGDFSVVTEQASLFGAVDLHSNYVPAGVSGSVTIKSRMQQNPPVVISVNGVIQGVADTFTVDGHLLFSTVIPETAFKQGSNELKFFLAAVDAAGKQYLLSQERMAQSYTLQENEIAMSGNKNIPIYSSALQGNVDGLTVDAVHGNSVWINGWAVNMEKLKPVDSVLLFANGKFINASNALEPRSDVSKSLKNKKLEQSGFSFLLPPKLANELRKIRVFAISDGIASELSYGRKTGLQSDYLKRLPVGRMKYTLQGNTVSSSTGDKFTVDPGKIQGSVDLIHKKGSDILLAGWAADIDKSQPVDTILIFDNERFVGAGATRVYRKEVGKLLKNDKLVYTGFDYILPAKSVHDLNDLRLFAVSDGFANELNFPRKLRTSEVGYSLEAGRIVSSTGEKWPVISNAVQGLVETITREPRVTTVAGWAANVSKSAPADSILVFAGGRYLGVARTNTMRADVSKAFSDINIISSGFQFILPSKELKDLSQIRVFALSKGVATELNTPHSRQAETGLLNDLPAENLYALQGNSLISPDGKQIPLVPQNVQGSLDTLTRNADGVVLSGWAADIARKQPVELMLIFHDGKLLAAKTPNTARPDVSKVFSSEVLEYSGYVFLLPAKAVSSMKKIRLFAVSGATAAEIKYIGTLPEEDSPLKLEDKSPVFSNKSTAEPKAAED